MKNRKITRKSTKARCCNLFNDLINEYLVSDERKAAVYGFCTLKVSSTYDDLSDDKTIVESDVINDYHACSIV